MSVPELIASGFNPMAKIALVLGAGSGLAWRRVLDKRTCLAMAKVVYNLMLPCLLLTRIALSASADAFMNWWALPCFAFIHVTLDACCGFLLTFVLIAVDRIRFGKHSEQLMRTRAITTTIVNVCTFGNQGYLPLAAISTIALTVPWMRSNPDAAETAIAYISVYLVVSSPSLWMIGVKHLEWGNARAERKNAKIRKFLDVEHGILACQKEANEASQSDPSLDGSVRPRTASRADSSVFMKDASLPDMVDPEGTSVGDGVSGRDASEMGSQPMIVDDDGVSVDDARSLVGSVGPHRQWNPSPFQISRKSMEHVLTHDSFVGTSKREGDTVGPVPLSLNLGGLAGLGKKDSSGEMAESFRLKMREAELGDAGAQFFLAVCYEGGLGVEKDPAEAVRLYGLAAEQGNRSALFSLGMCYERGVGVKQDSIEAARLFALAEEGRGPRKFSFAVDGLRVDQAVENHKIDFPMSGSTHGELEGGEQLEFSAVELSVDTIRGARRARLLRLVRGAFSPLERVYARINGSPRVQTFRAKAKRIVTPPMMGIATGIVLALLPQFLRDLLFNPLSFLSWPMDAAGLLGQGALPLALLVLGFNIFGAAPHRGTPLGITMVQVAAVVVTRLLLIPCLCTTVTLLFRSRGWLPEDPIMAYVILLEGVTTPAMGLQVQAELNGRCQKETASLLFWTNICGMVSVTGWLIFFAGILDQ